MDHRLGGREGPRVGGGNDLASVQEQVPAVDHEGDQGQNEHEAHDEDGAGDAAFVRMPPREAHSQLNTACMVGVNVRFPKNGMDTAMFCCHETCTVCPTVVDEHAIDSCGEPGPMG